MSKRLESRDIRDGYACNHIQDDLTGSEVYELFDEWFNEVRADAWDEGYKSGHSRAMRRMSDEPNVDPADNPYREEQ